MLRKNTKDRKSKKKKDDFLSFVPQHLWTLRVDLNSLSGFGGVWGGLTTPRKGLEQSLLGGSKMRVFDLPRDPPENTGFWGVFGSKKSSFKHPPEGGAQARWVA